MVGFSRDRGNTTEVREKRLVHVMLIAVADLLVTLIRLTKHLLFHTPDALGRLHHLELFFLKRDHFADVSSGGHHHRHHSADCDISMILIAIPLGFSMPGTGQFSVIWALNPNQWVNRPHGPSHTTLWVVTSRLIQA